MAFFVISQNESQEETVSKFVILTALKQVLFICRFMM